MMVEPLAAGDSGLRLVVIPEPVARSARARSFYVAVKCIEIIATPPGEAPEEIRRSWIGVVIPLPRGYQEERATIGYGVLTGPRSWLLALLPFLHKNKNKWTGYWVRGREAVDALAKKDPAAAQWWKENAPHVMGRLWGLSFPRRFAKLWTDEHRTSR